MTSLLLVGAVFFFIQPADTVHAGPSHNVSGFGWSDMPDGKSTEPHVGRGAGWISLNSNGLAVGGVSSGYTSSVDYGVNIDFATGDVSGYGWSEHMGWVDFNNVTVDTETGKFSGIAYFTAGGTSQSGGWDGELSMSGTNPAYGVYMTTPPNQLSPGSTARLTGFAWGGAVIGWVDFKYSECGEPGDDDFESVCTIEGSLNYIHPDDVDPLTQIVDNDMCIEPPSSEYCANPAYSYIDTEQAFLDYNEEARAVGEPQLLYNQNGNNHCVLEGDLCSDNSDPMWDGIQDQAWVDGYNSDPDNDGAIVVGPSGFCIITYDDMCPNVPGIQTDTTLCPTIPPQCDPDTDPEQCENITIPDFREI